MPLAASSSRDSSLAWWQAGQQQQAFRQAQCGASKQHQPACVHGSLCAGTHVTVPAQSNCRTVPSLSDADSDPSVTASLSVPAVHSSMQSHIWMQHQHEQQTGRRRQQARQTSMQQLGGQASCA